MKAVQVGILAALTAVAGLLYLNLDKQAEVPVSAQVNPEPLTVEAETAAPAEADPAVEAVPSNNSSAEYTSQTPERTYNQPAQRPVRPNPARREPAREIAQVTRDPKLPEAPPIEDRPAPTVQTAPRETPSERTVSTPDPAPEGRQNAQDAPRPKVNILRPDALEESSRKPVRRELKTVTIPAGTLLHVRTGETLDSRRVQTGDTFIAHLDEPLIVDGFVIAEKRARVEGTVVESQDAGRVKGVAQLTIALKKLETADGQSLNLQTAAFSKEADKDLKGDAVKVGVMSGIGAAIGAIAGGGKGAAIGAAAGGATGAGTVMATKGKPVVVESETRLTFRLEQPVTVTERLK